MVEVPIMDVINMVRMFNGRVAAVSAVLVTVVGMGAGGAHKMWWLVNTDKENSFAEIRGIDQCWGRLRNVNRLKLSLSTRVSPVN